MVSSNRATILERPLANPEGPLYFSPIGLFPFQAEAVARSYWQYTESGEPSTFILFDTGVGKQAPVSEPVLTPGGWRAIGDIQPGDEVFGLNGRCASVLSVHPQVDRTTYRIEFSDGSWTRCGPDHLWTVSFWGSDRGSGSQKRIRRMETISTKEILDRGVCNPAGRRKFSIPITAPVQYPEVSLPVDPYTLGVLLGNAYVSPTGQVQISSDAETILGLDAVGTLRAHHTSHEVVSFSSGVWAYQLVDMGLAGHRSWEKFIPPIYMHAHEAARRELLAGLLDTDGSPIPTGGVEFSTTSESLADGVRELAESLGGTATKSASRITSYTHDEEVREGRPSWRVNVKLPVQPHRLSRKAALWVEPTKYPVARWIESIEQVDDEDSVCIRIDRTDGLYLTRHHIVTHNTHVSMAAAALMVEDGLLDHIIIVAEANKTTDWADEDFPTFTKLTSIKYAGALARRKKILLNPPQVLVMTYETGRQDICTFKGRTKTVAEPQFLTEFLRGKRIFIVFDEMTKLRNRSSMLYKSWDYLINRVLRKEGTVMVSGLTATSVEKSPEDHFNAARILAPWRAPRVEDFYRQYVASYDQYGAPRAWKNLRRDEHLDPAIEPLSEVFGPITLRKRKTDPDVLAQFPAKMENPPRFVTLSEGHLALYQAVQDSTESDDLRQQQQAFGVLRQIAGHPASILRSQGALAKIIVDTLGASYIESLSSTKVEEMLAWARRLVEQQGVIFTFYGQSILPLLHTALKEAGFSVAINHGGMNAVARQHSQDSFKRGNAQIFLSSDAGARGLNLGCGSALLHYELPLMHSLFIQRSDRIHRINSQHASVTIDSLVAADTVEYPLAQVLNKRNEWMDAVLDDSAYSEDEDPGDQYLTAAMRKAMLLGAKRASS